MVLPPSPTAPRQPFALEALARLSLADFLHPDPTRPGTDAQGRTYTEAWGWLGAAQQGAR